MARRVAWIAAYTLLEALRNRLLWLVLAVLVAALAAAQFLGALAITETREIQTAFLSAFLRLAAVFVVCMFVITSVARELNEKIMDLLLSLPMPRAGYYLGKLAGFGAVALAVCAATCAPLLMYAQAEQVLLWGLSLGAELLIMAAASLLCMFTFSHVTVALSAVTGFYLLARTMGAVQLLEHASLVDPHSLSHRIMNALMDAIAYLLPDLYRFADTRWLVYGEGEWALLPPLLGQTAVYLLLLGAAALFDLYRKSL